MKDLLPKYYHNGIEELGFSYGDDLIRVFTENYLEVANFFPGGLIFNINEYPDNYSFEVSYAYDDSNHGEISHFDKTPFKIHSINWRPRVITLYINKKDLEELIN